MSTLRLNPSTGRLAEQVPAAGRRAGQPSWFSWDWDSEGALSVSMLTDADVAEWIDVTPAPKPADPEYAFTIGCNECQDPAPATTVAHERDQASASHQGDHAVAPYAVRIHHPAHDPDAALPPLAAGSSVTFHGSTTGHVADLVDARIQGTRQGELDGQLVDGYVLEVGIHQLWTPATAVHVADPPAA